MFSWIARVNKGIVIASGFILPGFWWCSAILGLRANDSFSFAHPL